MNGSRQNHCSSSSGRRVSCQSCCSKPSTPRSNNQCSRNELKATAAAAAACTCFCTDVSADSPMASRVVAAQGAEDWRFCVSAAAAVATKENKQRLLQQFQPQQQEKIVVAAAPIGAVCIGNRPRARSKPSLSPRPKTLSLKPFPRDTNSNHKPKSINPKP